MLIETLDVSVHPDNFQFYLRTRTAEHASDQVSGEGYEAHLEATSPGFVYVGTLKRFTPMPVQVEVHDAEPGPAEERWQHVAEVSIQSDGVVEILHWGDDNPAATISTPSGPLRLRVLWGGLEPNLTEGMPEGRPSQEHLMLQVWPAPMSGRQVLRWWSEWKLPAREATAPDGREQIEGQDEVVRKIQGGLVAVPVFLAANPAAAPPLPGGTTGYCSVIWGDPLAGTWWVDGYEARRVLRLATEDEVRALVKNAPYMPIGIRDPRWSDPRWVAMLKRIGVKPP
jgi:hypothetical protein